MLRHELLEKHRTRNSRERMRAFQEAQTISALPDGLQVRRAYTTTEQANNRKIAAAHGIWEVDVADYLALKELLASFPVLAPTDAYCIVKDDGTFRSTSFYPVGRVPQKWWDRADMEITEADLFIWQGAPVGGHTDCAVTVEWFIEPREGQFVNVRANVLQHGCRYFYANNKWALHNAPNGNVRRTGLQDGRPCYVTVWWYNGAFNEDYTFFDMLLEGRATQDV